MKLTALSLAAVRNYASLEFEPAPGLNVFVGANGQGKSNLLEAIGLLGIGKSFRTAAEREIVMFGLSCASISGTADIRAGSVRLSCTITATANGAKKLYAVNGQSVRYASYLGRARVVTFTPHDVALADGPPALRRTLLNAALSQESPNYYAALAAYNRAVQQKGALLRGVVSPDPDLLATYNERMVEHGAKLIATRHRFSAALGAAAARLFRGWTTARGAEVLSVTYSPNVPFELPAEDEIALRFAERLRANATAEALRRSCLTGPHRDDVRLELNGRPLAAYGSQGQQRAAVLAIKIAEYEVLRDRSGEPPLLLLDDVLSELDHDRQRDLLATVATAEQAFLTATSVPHALDAAQMYRIDAARLLPAAS